MPWKPALAGPARACVRACFAPAAALAVGSATVGCGGVGPESGTEPGAPPVRADVASSQGADPAKAEVLAAAQALFDAMAARDSAAVADILLPEGGFFAVATTNGRPAHTYLPHADFGRLVAAQPAPPIERMWDAHVVVHDPIAMVWTPYDFYRGEDFSHCGVDGFSLIRTEAGWKIAGIIFTRETVDCPDHPDGPPGGGS